MFRSNCVVIHSNNFTKVAQGCVINNKTFVLDKKNKSKAVPRVEWCMSNRLTWMNVWFFSPTKVDNWVLRGALQFTSQIQNKTSHFRFTGEKQLQ